MIFFSEKGAGTNATLHAPTAGVRDPEVNVDTVESDVFGMTTGKTDSATEEKSTTDSSDPASSITDSPIGIDTSENDDKKNIDESSSEEQSTDQSTSSEEDVSGMFA